MAFLIDIVALRSLVATAKQNHQLAANHPKVNTVAEST
jgi:hypothetical protein